MATAASSEDEQPSVIDTRRAPAARQEPNLVYGATVQLPTFDKAEPWAWFRIADANFGIRRVTDPVTKVLLRPFQTRLGNATQAVGVFGSPSRVGPVLADIRKKALQNV